MNRKTVAVALLGGWFALLLASSVSAAAWWSRGDDVKFDDVEPMYVQLNVPTTGPHADIHSAA